MIRDLDILERRIQAMREIPWPIPALVIMQMTDEDLDRLDACVDAVHYWGVLNGIVRRIREDA